MATNAQVRFGRYTGKNVVVKDVEYLTPVIDASSGNVRNMELTPAGGVVRMQQDILSTSAEKIYNYASYVIGDLLYYGYVDCEGVAGGIVTYRIRVDAATTMWRAGAFNINNYCQYSPLGDSYYNDTRRARSSTITRIQRGVAEGSEGLEWIYNNITYGCVVINVCSYPLPHDIDRCLSTSPANVETYVLPMDNFYTFYKNIQSYNDTSKPIAQYIKSILNVTWIPLAPENIKNLNLFEEKSILKVYLWNPTNPTQDAVAITTGQPLYSLRNKGGRVPLLAITPQIYIGDLVTQETRFYNIEYNCFGFGNFKIAGEQLPQNAQYISAEIYLDLTGMTYRTIPVITINTTQIQNQVKLNELSAVGTFTCSIPMLSETDVSNWQLRESMLRRDTGFSVATNILTALPQIASGNVAGTTSAALNLGKTLISAAQEQKNIEWQKQYSGGTVLSSLGSVLSRISEAGGYVIANYNAFRDTNFPEMYGYPDHKIRNIYTEISSGYVQTINANIYRLGYPEEIAESAERAFDSGVWIA